MRICHIIGAYRPLIGGAERATETLTSTLAEQGEDVIVLTRRFARSDAAFEVIKGVPVYRLGLPGGSKLHALSFGLHALALLAARFRRYRILHVQDADVSLLVAMVARMLPGRRLVITLHGQSAIIGRDRHRAGRLRLRGMVRATDLYTSLNPEVTRLLTDAGAKRQDIREVANGIDGAAYRPATSDERSAAREALGLEPDEFVTLYLGRLHPIKRVDLLVDAWSGLSPHRGRRLVIVGSGSEEDRLRDQSAGIASIRMDGPTDDVPTYLRAADVFVNPSGDPSTNVYEGLSVALLEAMFVGLMPIVTSGPGNDLLVENGVTGLSFSAEDRDGLMACLSLAMQDHELRSRIGRQARESVVDVYSSEAVAQQVAALYRELVG